MKKFWKGINGYFIHIMISFILLVLLPVGLMGTVWYGKTRRQEQDYHIQREKEKMHAVSLEYERRIASVETDLATFQYSNAFRRYAAGNTRNTYDIKEDIQALIQKNEVLTSLYLYDALNKTIYNSASGLYQIGEFYDTQWLEQVENSIQYKRLPIRSSINKAFYEQIQGTGLERIYSNRSYLSILAQKTFNIYLLANIDLKNLGEYVQKIYPLDIKKGEKAYVVSGSGQIYYASEYGRTNPLPILNRDQWPDGETAVLEDGNQILFARKMAYKDLYYVETYSKKSFFETGSGRGYYIVGVCTFLSLFLVGLAYIMSRRLYQPIKGLYAEIKKTSVLSDESMYDDLEVLQRAFAEMSRHYESAVTEEKSYQEFMKMSHLRMMLNGIFSQKKFLQENEGVYLKSDSCGYQLLVCDLGGTQEMSDEEYENFSFRLKAVINSYLQAVSKGLFTEVEDTCYAAFYTITSEEDAEYFKSLLQKAVKQLTGDGSHFTASHFCASPVIGCDDDIRDWYRLCLEKIRDAMFFDNGRDTLLEAGKQKEPALLADSTVNYEGALIRAMVTGDKESLRVALSKLANQLEEVGHAGHAVDLCCHIMVTLDQEFMIYKLLDTDVQKECRKQVAMNSLINYMSEILGRTLEYLKQDNSLENRYCRDAKSYLEQNYMRDINVTEVADALGISYAYLSKIFKTQPEGNGRLSEYLNIIRINKSKNYLKETALTLHDIAEKVGYNNVQSFQRFFKKYEHMTPGEYRKYLLSSQKII